MNTRSSLVEQADKLKKYVRFGASSWAYAGWQGIVYFKEYPKDRFKKECLAEYAADGRFATVGMDLFFYQPPTDSLLRYYAEKLPPNFKTCSKVWENLTIYRFPDQVRYGKLRGQINPSFLNADLFVTRVLQPHQEAFKEHTGPFIFEFQYIKSDDLARSNFAAALDAFFGSLPGDFQYSVEIRNKSFLKTDYFDVLRKHRVAHVFNQWTYMPPIREQMRPEALTADFMIARILTPPGMSYQESVDNFEPFDRLAQPLPDMRADVLRLIELAIDEEKMIYVLINNRAEGCAPLTILELQGMALATLQGK